MATTELKAVITAEDRASGTIKGVSNSMSNLASSVATYGKVATVAFVGAATFAVKSAADVEMLRANLDVLTGSADKGRKMFDQLYKMAAKTPFETPELVDAAQMLLGYGVAQEKILPNLKMIGDIALGNKEKFKGLTYAFSQVQATGRLMGQDLLQMINNGFNPLQVISEKTGKSMSQLKDDMEKGAISAQMVEDAFKTATSEGGRFFGGMDKGSQTLEGRFSTLKDSVMTFARSLVGLNSQGDIVKGGLFDKVGGAVDLLTKSLEGLDQKVFGFINRIKEWINTNIWAQTFLIAFQERLQNIWEKVQNLWDVIQKNKDAIQAWVGLIGGVVVVVIYALTTALQGAIWYFTKFIQVLGFLYDKAKIVSDFLRSVFGSVIDWIVLRWNFGWDNLKKIFNWIIGAINKVTPSLNKVFGWNIGQIPSFQSGGIMQSDGLAFLHKGEKVTPTASVINNDQGVTVQFYGNINNTANASLDAIGQRLGRQVQLAQQGI